PPGQSRPPCPGPRARRRDRPVRGRAGDAPAGRGAGGGRLMGAAAALVTVGDALAAAIARLAAAGVPEPRADAEVLLARALDTTRVGLVVAARRPLPETAARDFAALVARRAAREPLPYIVGEREFWSLPLTVDRRVLVPRPETELVVETALRLAPAAGPDGLAALGRLVAEAPRVLVPGGWLVVEVGAGQAPAVRRLAEAGAERRQAGRRGLGASEERSARSARAPDGPPAEL